MFYEPCIASFAVSSVWQDYNGAVQDRKMKMYRDVNPKNFTLGQLLVTE